MASTQTFSILLPSYVCGASQPALGCQLLTSDRHVSLVCSCWHCSTLMNVFLGGHHHVLQTCCHLNISFNLLLFTATLPRQQNDPISAYLCGCSLPMQVAPSSHCSQASVLSVHVVGDSMQPKISLCSCCIIPAAFPADPDRKLDTFTPRLLYCLIHLGQFVFGLYKLNAMGLLPTHASDWLSAIAAPKSLEHSYGAL